MATQLSKQKHDDEVLELEPILTEKEIEIIRMIAEGLSNKEISFKVDYSYGSLETIRNRIYLKLRVRNAPHCVAYALRNGIIS